MSGDFFYPFTNREFENLVMLPTTIEAIDGIGSEYKPYRMMNLSVLNITSVFPNQKYRDPSHQKF
jgi:hypothetical protein